MKTKGLALNPYLRVALYGSFATLLLSGIGWIYVRLALREDTEFGSIPSPYEALCLQVHGAGVQVFLVIIGWLLPAHILRAYRARKNLFSGGAMLMSLVWLVFTGYLLYYVGSEKIRDIASVAHSVVGVLIPGVLALHVIHGKRAYARRNSFPVLEVPNSDTIAGKGSNIRESERTTVAATR
jgi:hypothetical protein